MIGYTQMLKKYFVYHSYLNDLFHSLFKKLKEPCIDLISQFIPQDGVVLDVGANYGQFAAYAAKIIGSKGKVYCFEPLAYPLMVLKHMVYLRNLKQVVAVKSAASDRSGMSLIATPIDKGWKPKHALSYLSTVKDGNAVYEKVNLLRLDEYCDLNRIKQIDFIKCDVEGSEFKVFSGATEILSRFKPTIYCEIEKSYCERQHIDVDSIFGLFAELGYRSYLPDSNCALTSVDGYTRKGNYFFMHTQ